MKKLFFIIFLLQSIDCFAQDGAIDLTFDPGTGANSDVVAITLQPDNKILIGGWFTTYNGTPRNYIGRINTDGSLDVGFNPGSGFNGDVQTIVVQPDGKILVGGSFSTFNGTTRNKIARLNTDGTLDLSFNPGGINTGTLNKILLLPDGKILVAGSIQWYDGQKYLLRLNADGSVDNTFHTYFNNHVYTLALQADNKVLAGGYFTQYGGTTTNYLARINSDGALDGSFNIGAGATSSVISILVQPDNKIIINGGFWSFNGVSRNHIARLNMDGSIDASFNPGTGANYGGSNYIQMQQNGKLILGGDFTIYNGFGRSHITRINSDGSNDNSFLPGAGMNNWQVYGLAIQPDGKILAGGDFTTYNGVGRNRIVRINSTIGGALPVRFISLSATKKYNAIFLNWQVADEQAIDHYEIERSADGVEFQQIGTLLANAASNRFYQWQDKLLVSSAFYRIKSVGISPTDITYSRILKVAGSNDEKLIVTCERQGEMDIQFLNKVKGVYQLTIFNAAGQLLYKKQMDHNYDSQVETVILPGSIKPGIYIVHMTGPDLSVMNTKISLF